MIYEKHCLESTISSLKVACHKYNYAYLYRVFARVGIKIIVCGYFCVISSKLRDFDIENFNTRASHFIFLTSWYLVYRSSNFFIYFRSRQVRIMIISIHTLVEMYSQKLPIFMQFTIFNGILMMKILKTIAKGTVQFVVSMLLVKQLY